MTITIKYSEEWDEFQVPTLLGVTGEDQVYFTSDKEDAVDTALFIHGPDVKVRIRKVA